MKNVLYSTHLERTSNFGEHKGRRRTAQLKKSREKLYQVLQWEVPLHIPRIHQTFFQPTIACFMPFIIIWDIDSVELGKILKMSSIHFSAHKFKNFIKWTIQACFMKGESHSCWRRPFFRFRIFIFDLLLRSSGSFVSGCKSNNFLWIYLWCREVLKVKLLWSYILVFAFDSRLPPAYRAPNMYQK